MTPKEKARELIDKYFYLFSVELENTIANYEAKECALIAVDEVLDYLKDNGFSAQIEYYQEVKKEIEKI